MRIRRARAEDIDAVTALSRLAGVDIEVEVMDAVRTGSAGFLCVMAGRFAEVTSGSCSRTSPWS
ncbi:hypothetical protein [Micromonospora sp. NPDC023644]|uniref:hypothetical protein n=1 Tax=Micromonospora sp. NPDC023644 TaxID=3154321 RepID=UPI0033E40710